MILSKCLSSVYGVSDLLLGQLELRGSGVSGESGVVVAALPRVFSLTNVTNVLDGGVQGVSWEALRAVLSGSVSKWSSTAADDGSHIVDVASFIKDFSFMLGQGRKPTSEASLTVIYTLLGQACNSTSHVWSPEFTVLENLAKSEAPLEAMDLFLAGRASQLSCADTAPEEIAKSAALTQETQLFAVLLVAVLADALKVLQDNPAVYKASATDPAYLKKVSEIRQNLQLERLPSFVGKQRVASIDQGGVTAVTFEAEEKSFTAHEASILASGTSASDLSQELALAKAEIAHLKTLSLSTATHGPTSKAVAPSDGVVSLLQQFSLKLEDVASQLYELKNGPKGSSTKDSVRKASVAAGGSRDDDYDEEEDEYPPFARPRVGADTSATGTLQVDIEPFGSSGQGASSRGRYSPAVEFEGDYFRYWGGGHDASKQGWTPSQWDSRASLIDCNREIWSFTRFGELSHDPGAAALSAFREGILVFQFSGEALRVRFPVVPPKAATILTSQCVIDTVCLPYAYEPSQTPPSSVQPNLLLIFDVDKISLYFTSQTQAVRGLRAAGRITERQEVQAVSDARCIEATLCNTIKCFGIGSNASSKVTDNALFTLFSNAYINSFLFTSDRRYLDDKRTAVELWLRHFDFQRNAISGSSFRDLVFCVGICCPVCGTYGMARTVCTKCKKSPASKGTEEHTEEAVTENSAARKKKFNKLYDAHLASTGKAHSREEREAFRKSHPAAASSGGSAGSKAGGGAAAVAWPFDKCLEYLAKHQHLLSKPTHTRHYFSPIA